MSQESVVVTGGARNIGQVIALLRRIGQPDDAAQAVSFFCDARSGFITGQTLFVCGGATFGPAPT
ncbi:SDR family oxidoreductase [Halomonas sp. WWR20]